VLRIEFVGPRPALTANAADAIGADHVDLIADVLDARDVADGFLQKLL
jgi:hypothetical protein